MVKKSSYLKFREARDIPRPLHGREQDPRREFTDCVQPNDIPRVGDMRVAGRGVGLRPHEEGDVVSEVGRGCRGGVLSRGKGEAQHVLTGPAGSSTLLHSCTKKQVSR